MNIVYKSRVILIRFAKVFPFILCFIVFLSLSEAFYALIQNDYVLFNDGITLNTPISWKVAQFYQIGVYSIIIAIFLSISFETCIWNKLSIFFLCVLMIEQKIFPTIELYEYQIYAIVIANLLVSGFFVWKGIRILTNK